MNSKERIQAAVAHRRADRVAVDMGNSVWTGIHAKAVAALRDFYGLPKRLVKVWEPYQFLGECDADLLDALGVDTVKMDAPGTAFGFRNEGWREFRTWWGQTVLVSEHFRTSPHPESGVVIYPEGDESAPPSGHMPEGSYYFDTIIRQGPFDEEHWNVEDNLEEFTPITESDLEFYRKEAARLRGSERAVLACLPGTHFGDIFAVPAPWMKRPRGLRSISEWYMALAARPDAIHRIFDYQLANTLANLPKIYQAVGETVTVALVCGADFGTQSSQFCSAATYNELYAPYHRAVNGWIHGHTGWKTMKHSCGAVRPFMESFIAAGFDILNPIQISAKDMDPAALKRDFGDRLTFWGGGVDTQKTLPFGTPAEVRDEVLRLCAIFAPGGGFVFNTVHNIQANVPVENLAAMIAAVREFNRAGG